jgi:hypothetical protein
VFFEVSHFPSIASSKFENTAALPPLEKAAAPAQARF